MDTRRARPRARSNALNPRCRRQPAPGSLSVCEHAFVSIKGSPYARFQRALTTGNLLLIRTAAAELSAVALDDALKICVAYRAEGPAYERAAVRWLGRFCLEHKGVTIEEIFQAAEALERLPTSTEEAAGELQSLLTR